MTIIVDKNEMAYWITVRGIAKKAMYKFGSGPLSDFVHGTVTRSCEDVNRVREFLFEQVELSSWIVKNPTDVLRFTKHATDSTVGDKIRRASRSMLEDIRAESDIALQDNVPAYYRLRFVAPLGGTGRFLVAIDFDDNESEDCSNPLKWESSISVKVSISILEDQYKKAKLPMPLIEIMVFNKKHQPCFKGNISSIDLFEKQYQEIKNEKSN